MAETRISCREWAENDPRKSSSDDKKQNATSYSNRGFLFLLLGAGGLLGYIAMTSYNHKDSYNERQSESKHRNKRQAETCHVDMCLTQECIHASSSILQSMDVSVDPCEDFFQYTCGGWIKENEHQTGTENLFYAINQNLLPEKIDRILNQLLKQNLPIPEEFMETKPYQNLFTFHESCMFVSPETNDEAVELLEGLQQFQIGRPFDPDSWNLTKAILELMRINGVPLLDIVIQSDLRIPGKYAINITPPRRYGLIPSLLGPKIPNPGVQESFRLHSRRALFGDLSNNLIMKNILSALDMVEPAGYKAVHKDYDSTVKGRFEGSSAFKKEAGSMGNVVGKPSLNILPIDDFLEKVTTTTNVPPTTMTPETIITTLGTTTTTTEEPVRASTTEASTDTPSFNTMPLPSPTSGPTSDKDPSLSTTITPPSPLPTSSENPPEPTVLGPLFNTSTDIPDYAGEEDYTEYEYRKIISRKSVFKFFKRDLAQKRTEAIGTMVQNFFSNMTEDTASTTLGNFQADDIYSAVIDHFVPLLDEIQPTEQEELQAQQHSLLFSHFTVDKLQKLVPMIEWRYLLSELFGKNITEEDNIYIYHPAYLVQLNHLLTALDPWMVHYGMIALYAFDVLSEASVASPDMDREDFCLQASKNVFGDAMSHMYLHHVGNKTINNIRKYTESILANLRDEVENSLTWATWLSPSDRQEALKKLSGLQAEVAALDRHWDIDYINESHEGINLNSEDSFLQHVMVVYRTFRTELYHVYSEPVDKEILIWSYTVQPFIVNAFYMRLTNTVVFPAAFFQKPYYSPKAPEYINYGATGTSMAHEIFHLLDLSGTLFDHQGAMSRPFSNETRSHLRDTVDCYHKLLTDTFYEEITLQHTPIAMEIDSTSTLNENLADIGGIRHAFRAYQRWEANHYREPRLPALNLTPYQLFFVAAVRPYCAVIPSLAKIFLMEMDEHLPNGMRMNAMMMNTPEFAQVFNCRPESRMVANKTCPIF